MDEMTVLVEGAVGGIAARDVRVEWEEGCVTMSAEAAGYVEKRWGVYVAEAEAKGKSLFNGAITRLIGVRREGEGVVLRLGRGDYKTFVVTRLRDRAWFESHEPGAMMRALGNSVFLTRGEEGLLGIRSERVSAYGGRAHLIGGVLDVLGSEEKPADVRGVVGHLLVELGEEVGMGKGDLAGGGPRLLGVVEDEVLGQPEMVWGWEAVKELGEIAGMLEESEHAGAVVVRRGEMAEAVWERMTPVARYAWRKWSGK